MLIVRLVILKARYSQGRKEFIPVFQESITLTESDELTSLVSLPLVTRSTGHCSTDEEHVIVTGFSSGYLRIYSDRGQLVLQKAFQV